MYNERSPRKFQVVDEPEKIKHLIQSYAIDKVFFVSGDDTHTPAKVIQFKEPNIIMLETTQAVSGMISIYTVLKKYIEFIATVKKDMGSNCHALSVESCRIATQSRAVERYVADQSKVFVNNIRASRNVINASLFNVPTSVKVHFKQYAHNLSHLADEVILDVFDKTKEKLEIVRKSGKIYYIADTQNEYSYDPEDIDKYVDYGRYSDTDTQELIREYRKQKIVSEMIVPIHYTGHDGIPIPLGYIQLSSKRDRIPIEKAEELRAIASELVQKMRDSNTVVINERQTIENISREGMRLRISNEELKRLLPDQSGMTFDVIFKMTQPMTISTEIIYTGHSDGDLILGLKIVGHSTKSGDFNRYYQMLESLAM